MDVSSRREMRIVEWRRGWSTLGYGTQEARRVVGYCGGGSRGEGRECGRAGDIDDMLQIRQADWIETLPLKKAE